MLQTYKATLNGNQLEWNGEVPKEAKTKESVSVIVMILNEETSKRDLRSFGLSNGDFVVPDNFDAPCRKTFWRILKIDETASRHTYTVDAQIQNYNIPYLK